MKKENEEKIAEISARLAKIIEYLSDTPNSFALKLGYQRAQTIYDILNMKSAPSYDFFNRFTNTEYSDIIDIEWLLTGKGEMLKKTGKKIPLYNVDTIGGVNERSANMDGVIKPSDWIDAGDWFMEATAAMHHYGDSMMEYPSGCILALREISDRRLIVWGKNYVIETDEYRITKRLQQSSNPDCIMAYSTNEEKYADGTLIHQPIEIHKESIRRLAIVLGYVVKEQSSGIVYNVKNRR
jgi:hypothetical protein